MRQAQGLWGNKPKLAKDFMGKMASTLEGDIYLGWPPIGSMSIRISRDSPSRQRWSAFQVADAKGAFAIRNPALPT
ncbi:MAG: hypothetical protein ACK519_01505 [Sphingomonadaceae bacterium]|jgi:hypothetical protein